MLTKSKTDLTNNPLIVLLVLAVAGFLMYNLSFMIVSRSLTFLLLLMIGLVLIAFFLKKPSYTIYAFMVFASVPAFLQGGSGIARGINLANVSWLMMVLFILFERLKTRRFYITSIDKYILLMALVMFIALLRGHFQYGSSLDSWLYSFAKPLMFLILYLIIFNNFSTERHVKGILALNVAISVTLAAVLLWRHHQGLAHGLTYIQARTGGITDNPNILTMLFIFNILIILLLFETTRDLKIKLFLMLASTPLFLGIIFSYTRKAYPTVIMAVLAYFILSRKGIRLLLAMMFFAVFIQFLPQSAVERARTVAQITEDGRIVLGSSAVSRAKLIKNGIEFLKDNPLVVMFGGGMGTYENNAYKYAKGMWHIKSEDPHNTIMSLICQTGILGLAIIVFFYFKIFSLCQKVKQNTRDIFTKKLAVVIQAQLLTYFVYSMVGSTTLMWDAANYSITFGSLVGCVLILQRNQRIRSLEHSKDGADLGGTSKS
jgi:O-Antigen ligase